MLGGGGILPPGFAPGNGLAEQAGIRKPHTRAGEGRLHRQCVDEVDQLLFERGGVFGVPIGLTRRTTSKGFSPLRFPWTEIPISIALQI